MERFKCLALLAMCLVVVVVYGQDPEGFFSIDCGSTDSFVDDATKLKYTSDDQYIDTRINANIASNYKSSIVVRSFPSGSRNCYSIKPVVRNSTYLIRVAFFHGNYDSHFGAQSKTPILFDLYIGASKWKTVNITDPDFLSLYEAITAALAEVLYVCLVNTGQGTPIIGLLEMRPMNSPLYPYVDETQFADLYGRCDFGGSKLTRYPDDRYDRIWVPLMLDEWTNISTRNKVAADFGNSYSELPSVVLQTAVIPSRSAPNSSNLNLSWTQQDGVIPPFVANFHFAEVENLAMLHHKNLLSLIGYCEEESCLALVYEYVPQGTLEDHSRGNRGTLGWRECLHIALEATQGLDYLHKGCRMPIVHRDVKCSNILLGDNLEAKVADLGLARAFCSNDQGTMATICGTPGYIDPEFFNSSMLTVKSDVYSFGIFLLEIIIGLPPIVQEGGHLLLHVRQKLQREDITSVVDGRFEGDYDVNSMWKVLELAMSCTQKESSPRPMMSDVVAELRECLDLETDHVKSQSKHRQNMSDRKHYAAVSRGDSLSIDGDSVGQQNMGNESLGLGYISSSEADFEGMLGLSLR